MLRIDSGDCICVSRQVNPRHRTGATGTTYQLGISTRRIFGSSQQLFACIQLKRYSRFHPKERLHVYRNSAHNLLAPSLFLNVFKEHGESKQKFRADDPNPSMRVGNVFAGLSRKYIFKRLICMVVHLGHVQVHF